MIQEVNHHRWYDRLFSFTVAIIGALSAILWGNVWSSVSNVQQRVGVLEGDKRVIDQKLDNITQTLHEIRSELKTISIGDRK